MSNETKVTYLPVSAIKVDPACQARAGMNSETINEYAEVMKERGDDPSLLSLSFTTAQITGCLMVFTDTKRLRKRDCNH
jgi:hypothetical protein